MNSPIADLPERPTEAQPAPGLTAATGPANTGTAPDLAADWLLDESEVLAGDYVSTVLGQAMHKLIPDDELEQTLADVKSAAWSRTLKEEPDPSLGVLRSVVLPLVWSGVEDFIDEPKPKDQVIHRYVFTLTPANLSPEAAQAFHRRMRRKLPYRMLASFFTGGIFGALAPLLVIMLSGSVSRHQIVWTLALVVLSVVSVISGATLVFFVARTLRVTDSTEVTFSLEGGARLAVVRTRRRVADSDARGPQERTFDYSATVETRGASFLSGLT